MGNKIDKTNKKEIADYEIRPLTEEEKTFSVENHNLLFWYIRRYRLDKDEWYDIPIIPYLTTIKKYFSIPRLQQYAFSTILKKSFDSVRQNYYRHMYIKRNMTEGGMCSLDYTRKNDKGSEYQIPTWQIDRKINLERDAISKETVKEFWDSIDNFLMHDQMKVVLSMLLDGYSKREIIKRMQEISDSPEWKISSGEWDFIVRQLRYAFKEAGLDGKYKRSVFVEWDILYHAMEKDIITRKGARFFYDGRMIGQGRNNAMTYLREHPKVLEEIMGRLRRFYKIT